MTRDTRSAESTGATHPTCEATYDGTERGEPSTTVVTTVAGAVDTAPTDLPPLQDAVDVEALDGLFTPVRGSASAPVEGYVTFQFGGCRVAVHGEGRVVVAPPER